MKQVHIVKQKSKRKVIKPVKIKDIRENRVEAADGTMIDSQHVLISLLLPPAVKAFYNALETEVEELCGKHYSHGTAPHRWGKQAGSIVLGNQRVAIEKSRVRDTVSGREIPLETYEQFQSPACFDESVFREGIRHVSQRDYESGIPKIAASFGVSKSTVSRSWIKSTQKHLKKLLTRDLRSLGIVAVFIDGKRFSSQGVIIALGVGQDGKKTVLGIYQSSSENSAACLRLLEDLEKRGLPEKDLLFVVDGGSGLNKALDEKYEISDANNRRALRVRCHVHKWNNLKQVLDEVGQHEVKPLFWALRDARDMTVAKSCSDALVACLRKHNVSALNSYLEAKDDLLAIHRLRLSAQLRKFFTTTNPIESLNSLLEEDLRRVKRWRSSEHFCRWVATASLQNERRMRKIKGFSGLPALVIRLQELCTHEEKQEIVDNIGVAA